MASYTRAFATQRLSLYMAKILMLRIGLNRLRVEVSVNMYALTPQQRRFAQAVASGSSYTQAYRAAYHCEKAKPKTIRTDASKLANLPKIVAAIEQMRRQAEWNEADWRRDTIMHLLEEAEHGDTSEDRLSAIGILMRMMR